MLVVGIRFSNMQCNSLFIIYAYDSFFGCKYSSIARGHYYMLIVHFLWSRKWRGLFKMQVCSTTSDILWTLRPMQWTGLRGVWEDPMILQGKKMNMIISLSLFMASWLGNFFWVKYIPMSVMVRFKSRPCSGSTSFKKWQALLHQVEQTVAPLRSNLAICSRISPSSLLIFPSVTLNLRGHNLTCSVMYFVLSGSTISSS